MDWELAKEATEVGALLVPLYAVVREAAETFQWEERSKDYISVFVSGALFHILAEASGMNDWYLSHGHAQKNWLQRKNNDSLASYRGNARVCSLAVWASQQPSR
jgi:hypothetical protein